MRKKALIFGITGQDGSYLAEFLLKKNYIVHGVKRKSSSFNTERIDDLFHSFSKKKLLFLHYGDLTDYSSVLHIIKKIKPHEIYNLAAQSHVGISFEIPDYTANVTALGVLKILEAIRTLNLEKKVKLYQAGSSEMFGSSKAPQDEKTILKPRSPYAISKTFAYLMCKNYREAYGIFIANGILFNHESPKRGGNFVTKKIISALVKFKRGEKIKLELGNLYSKRDWGHAEDYVETMWLMLQQKKPDDYVISTDTQINVKKFVEIVCKQLKLKLKWAGKGIKEVGYINNKKVININKKYFRPTEVQNLLGKSKYARRKLNWKPRYNINTLIKDMISKE